MDRLTNPMVDCERTIRQLDLSHWKDSKSYSLPTSPSSPPPRPSTFPSSPSKLTNTAAFSAPNSIFTTRTTCKVPLMNHMLTSNSLCISSIKFGMPCHLRVSKIFQICTPKVVHSFTQLSRMKGSLLVSFRVFYIFYLKIEPPCLCLGGEPRARRGRGLAQEPVHAVYLHRQRAQLREDRPVQPRPDLPQARERVQHQGGKY